MFLTIKRGEIKIEKGDKILIEGTLVNDKGLMAIKINGYDSKDVFSDTVIALNNKDSKKIKDETSVIGEIVEFQGVRPVVQFIDDPRKITLNNPDDILKVIKHSG